MSQKVPNLACKSISDVELDLLVLSQKIKSFALLFRCCGGECAPDRDDFGGWADIIQGFGEEIDGTSKTINEIKKNF